MDHAQIAILMLFVGLALIIAEFFIPSGGMIAILAVICLAVSVWAAYQAWWEDYPRFWWSYIATVVLLVPLSIGGVFYLLPRTSLGRNILLDAPSLDEVTPYTEEERRLRQMIGRRGMTISLLNPGGMVTVDGERFHCECPGLLIEAGEAVVVTGLKGNRLVVRPMAGQAEATPEGKPHPDDSIAGVDDEARPLDFDIPQS